MGHGALFYTVCDRIWGSEYGIGSQHATTPSRLPLRQRAKSSTLLDVCVSSLRRGRANLLCIVPLLTDDPRRESKPPMPVCLPWVWEMRGVKMGVRVIWLQNRFQTPKGILSSGRSRGLLFIVVYVLLL